MQSTPDRVGQRILCPKCYRAVSVPNPDTPSYEGDDDTIPTEREPDLHPRAAKILAPIMAKTAAPASAPTEAGAIVLFQPSAAVAADAMTQLTANITMRMKPPPEVPPPDLKLSTAVWIALTAAGIVLWCATVIYQGGPLHYVAALAVVELSIGIGWVAYVAGRTHWLKGLLTLFPPVTLYQISRGQGPNHNRPLRFFLSGLLLLALYYANPFARESMRRAFDMTENHQTPVVESNSPSERLASYTGRTDRTPLLDELKRISKPEIVNSAPPSERPIVAGELRKVIKMDDRPDVTAAALSALIAWVGDDAKPDLIAAVRSTSYTTRHTAIPMIANWKDEDAAKAVIPLLREREERHDVCATLKKIGTPAEQPLLNFLTGLNDSMAGVAALNVLDEIGTTQSVQYLGKYAENGEDLILRELARGKMESIKKRIK
ncbi:MAG: hypothetical protein U0798_12995 [Gemmataceae bacterium]